MADPFSRLIHELGSGIHSVHGSSQGIWGSRHPGHRLLIRSAIGQAPGLWRAEDLDLLADLTQPPRPFDRSLSISHTFDLGGWISVPRPAQVGWDVEQKARIQQSIVERVCTKAEVQAAPQPAFLWSAKEAFFKALEDDQPEAITQLLVSEWRLKSPGLWSWTGFGPRNGEGLLLDSESWTLATCLVR